jgi:5-hmdU DNA kinase, helical domain
MKKPPIPRPEIYDIYWRFAARRQQAFERRIANELPPWTDDPIIQSFKFCNVFRAADRVSQYLIRHIAYDHDDCSVDDRLFQILAFRFFSKIATWDTVRDYLGHSPTLEDLRSGAFGSAIEEARKRNGSIYTGAFILCASNAYGKPAKHLNHIELFRHMFLREQVACRITGARSLASVYEILHEYPLIGDFMAYQIAIDLNYSSHVNFSEDDFTHPGPGAIRGLRKVFETLGDFTPAEAILWMVDRQEEEFRRLGLKFDGLWGRRLHAIDCQGLFCETDKYCREAAPELRSARKRIKAKFVASSETITLFFPPKWKLNDRVPKGPVLGAPLQPSFPVSSLFGIEGGGFSTPRAAE